MQYCCGYWLCVFTIPLLLTVFIVFTIEKIILLVKILKTLSINLESYLKDYIFKHYFVSILYYHFNSKVYHNCLLDEIDVWKKVWCVWEKFNGGKVWWWKSLMCGKSLMCVKKFNVCEKVWCVESLMCRKSLIWKKFNV
jgi:hypothetical protein